MLIVEPESLQGSGLIFTTMVATVLISTFAHGITAFPRVNCYADRISKKKDTHDKMPEMIPVKELPVCLPWRQ